MINLKADNRVILTGAKYSYLSTNFASGSSSITVLNSDGFATDGFILIGSFGSESSEILKIKAVSTNSITLKTKAGVDTTTRFAHSESTRVTLIPYDQVEFYYEPTSTFIGTTSLSGKVDISTSDLFTVYADTLNTSGYGFFRFYNSSTLTYSTASNPIPYGGFNLNTVKQTLDEFFSLLNNNELKLISRNDALSWLNEGYLAIKNELNLINNEYNASAEIPLTITNGVSEYSLPDDFGDLISITDEDKYGIGFIRMEDVITYKQNATRYYIRGRYIGFIPAPLHDTTYYYRYLKTAPRLITYDQSIELPNNAFTCLKDFMLSRAYQKLKDNRYKESREMFINGINFMKINAIKRSANLDSWSIDPAANV